ncbi:MAG: outer membrane protein assembly factor BamA [Campylobacteraceae bacterium]|jgi:outer membrane protein insertion porin family|nr:outer membrane protein assembly factor BamA [Campylobacteraceae bacterium]
MKKIIFLPFLAASIAVSSPIRSINFDGLLYLSPETAKDMIGLKVGDEIDINAINNAVKTLFEQQYFEDIWVENNNGNIVVHVKEKPTIAKVSFEGVGENDKNAIESFLNLKKGEMYDFNKVEKSKDLIKKYFETKGFFDTIVEVETIDLNERSTEALFKVNRGENIIIQDVILHGSDKLSYRSIEPSISNKEREALGWLWGRNDGKVNLFELENDSTRIRDVYYKHGYLDAKVSPPYLRAYFDNYVAKLEYNVEEGKKYKIRDIRIDVPDGYLDVEKVKSSFLLRKGDTFDVTKLRRDASKIENLLADQGYAYVSVYPDVKQSVENSETDLIFTVIPGDKVFVRDVRIMGNSATLDRIIRRDVYLAPGDLYSRNELNESRNTLRRTGYFEDVSFKEERISKDEVDLVVTVKETQTGAIGGGIGYGSSDGFLINGYLSENNLFGSGVKASVNVERSDKELSGAVSLSNPRIFDSQYSVGGSVYRKDYDFYDYDEITTGGYVSVGRNLGKHTSVALKYVLEHSELDNMPSSTKYDYDSNFMLDSMKSSLVPSIVFNNTDDYYVPRRGVSASTSFEFAGAGGDQKFLKSITKFATYYGLEDAIGYDLILRYKAQFGWADDQGYFPINERLYLGGSDSVRGFESRSIAPKNQNNILLGGSTSFANSVEASIPLVDRLKMRGALFFDYGMIGEDGFDEKRSSAGATIEWISPLGPIQFIFARPIQKESGDRTSSFEFTIGRGF